MQANWFVFLSDFSSPSPPLDFCKLDLERVWESGFLYPCLVAFLDCRWMRLTMLQGDERNEESQFRVQQEGPPMFEFKSGTFEESNSIAPI